MIHGWVFLVSCKKLPVQCMRVILYSSENWTSNFLHGTRKTRLCLSGHLVVRVAPCPVGIHLSVYSNLKCLGSESFWVVTTEERLTPIVVDITMHKKQIR